MIERVLHTVEGVKYKIVLAKEFTVQQLIDELRQIPQDAKFSTTGASYDEQLFEFTGYEWTWKGVEKKD